MKIQEPPSPLPPAPSGVQRAAHPPSMADEQTRLEWLGRAPTLKSVQVSSRLVADLECLAVGAYSPVEGFMNKGDYESVLKHMRLESGAAWTLPITLPIDDEQLESIRGSKQVVLLSGSAQPLAILHVGEIYEYDRQAEARHVYRTEDTAHPGVALLRDQGNHLVGGTVTVLDLPPGRLFEAERLSPAYIRRLIEKKGWKTVCGFHARNPIYRAHEYLTKCALELVDGLLLHPTVGDDRGDNISSTARIASYQYLVENFYPPNRVILSVFPGLAKYAGPREAVFHALCRKNYGCTHMIVGRDHAGVGNYYGSFEAHEIFGEFTPAELGITPIFVDHAFWCRLCDQMATAKTCPHRPEERVALSATEVRRRLASGETIPPEFARPQIVEVLRQSFRRSSGSP
jgi:sulfate adenylyltransferase